jgi:hypothetical protein
MFDDVAVIYSYSLEQAIADGELVPIREYRWKALSDGKPIVATLAITVDISIAGIMEIWNEYVAWRKHTMPKLPEEEQLFSTQMNGRKVWVLEDGQAFTILYPEDY